MLSFELRTARVRLPNDSAFDARRRWTSRESLLLRLGDARGAEGYGEATPLPGFSAESLDEAYEQLSALPRDELASALDTREPESLLRALTRLLGPCCASARFAVESAALGLLACKEGVDLAELLARLPGLPAPTRSAQEVHCCQMIDLGANAPFDGASPWLKAKVGRDLVAELRALRGRPTGVSVRLDANGTLPPSRLDRVLESFAEGAPEFLEEPVPLRELGPPRRLPLKIAFDESLLAVGESTAARRVQEWLGSGNVAALIVKPMLVGGISRTLELFSLGRLAGVPLVFSHLHDGSVAARVYFELSRGLAARDLAMGLGQHASLQLWAEVQPAVGSEP